MKKISKLTLLLILSLALSACSQQEEGKKAKEEPDLITAPIDFYQGSKERINDSVGKENQKLNNALQQGQVEGSNSDVAEKTSSETAQKETVEKAFDEAGMIALAKKYSGAVIKTNMGDIEVKFYSEDAPVTVGNFARLAEDKFYDGTKFHRAIKGFMIQGGDPNSKDDDFSDDGMGGPGYKFKDEINNRKLVRGSLAMANSGPNTNGSQFFIVTAEAAAWLDGKHTNFGEVTKGMDVVEKIENVAINAKDHPIDDVVIEIVEPLEK